MVTRREFLKYGVLAGAGMMLPLKWLGDAPKVFAFSQSDNLRKFIQPLRGVGGSGIPVAAPDTVRQSWWQKGVTHYTIDIEQYEDQLHPDLPNPTRLWGYGQGGKHKHLGGIIAAKRGEPVQITFRNNLPEKHILPVDDTIMGVDMKQLNRADTHLHGGHVPWISDGGPYAWWDPKGRTGVSFLNNKVLRPGQKVPGNEAEFYYPNDQGARLMWYHDHSLGTTRLNAYAGVASGYVIYDDYELLLASQNHLPGPLDPRTVYMVFQDKVFVGNNTSQLDPGWFTVMPNSRPGDLWYAHGYDADLGPTGTPPALSVVPEFFGDTILVNGTAYPTLEVEPRQYRFRLLNACNARFLNPRLVRAMGKSFPDSTEPRPNAPGPMFVQIGTEGGFLPQPTIVNLPKMNTLLMAPAERADLIVDFRDIEPGSIFILYNDAPAPFPMGDDATDYYPNNPYTTPPPIAGFGPNTRTLLQIKVKALNGPADAPISLPNVLHPTDPFLVFQTPGQPTDIPANAKVRYLTLNEAFDEYGRLIQMLGTTGVVKQGPEGPEFGRAYMDDPTEVIHAGDTEVWEILNLTGDTHPIHFHLVNVQVLSRIPFDADTYAGGSPTYTGAPIAPDANELGWKETVRMNPEQVTRVLMKFDLPVLPFSVPSSPRTGGAEYVWHCHILEHEEHDMMRPLVVK